MGKRKGNLLLGFGIALVSLVFASTLALAEEKMTYEEYQAKLADYQKREAEANQEIARIEEDMEVLKGEIAALDERIAAVQSEVYGLVESDEVGIKTYLDQLKLLEEQARGLLALSQDELFGRRDEIKEVEEQLAELKKSLIHFLPEAAEQISAIEGLIAQLRQRVPALPEQYQVAKGDCLWNISRKDKIYNDPYMWPRIYRANREQIKHPDMIYPKQSFSIPRAVGESQHLVVRGEWLSKISGYASAYSDPTKWHKIYRANKHQIIDPSLVFPAQVLDIPRD